MQAPTIQDRPQPDGSDIRKATAADVDAVARSLAQGFYDDPHMTYIFNNDAKRLERLERGFTTFLERIWMPQDETYTHQRLIGAAAWLPPGTWHLSIFAQLRLLPALVRVARGDLPRLNKAITKMEKQHPHEPHFYLPAVGVTPAWQGRGYGAALVQPILDRCDAEGVPAYLEASSARSRTLYERLGFKVTDEFTYADDAPLLWAMWRDPAGR